MSKLGEGGTRGYLACCPGPATALSCSTEARPLIDLDEWAQCGVGWEAGLLGVFCSRFSREVVHESSGCALVSFLRCGCFVPINSCGRLWFFIIAPSVCWLVVFAELPLFDTVNSLNICGICGSSPKAVNMLCLFFSSYN